MKSWYLIHTKPRQERLAQENLERQGYSTYLPLAEIRRRRRGRMIRVIDAMFPRYLFINLSNETDDWRPIRSTIGVATLVKFGQVPVCVPNELISVLKERENSDGVHELMKNDYAPGDTVRIAEGPMEGFEGIFQCNTGRERSVLLIEIIQKQTKVEIETAKIVPVS